LMLIYFIQDIFLPVELWHKPQNLLDM
jgi:hypothetical protein